MPELPPPVIAKQDGAVACLGIAKRSDFFEAGEVALRPEEVEAIRQHGTKGYAKRAETINGRLCNVQGRSADNAKRT